jgi:hypothetical protein
MTVAQHVFCNGRLRIWSVVSWFDMKGSILRADFEKGKSNSGFRSGMTERKASARAGQGQEQGKGKSRCPAESTASKAKAEVFREKAE